MAAQTGQVAAIYPEGAAESLGDTANHSGVYGEGADVDRRDKGNRISIIGCHKTVSAAYHDFTQPM